MISRKLRFIKYVQNKLQQIIQSMRYNDVYTVVEEALKNIADWVHSNIHIDSMNCMADSQASTTEDVIQVVNDLVKQEVIPDGIQCYNIHHESILSDIFTNSALYDNNSYAS